eukprot:ANDGO_01654.mRNA.1 hypothetical protein
MGPSPVHSRRPSTVAPSSFLFGNASGANSLYEPAFEPRVNNSALKRALNSSNSSNGSGHHNHHNHRRHDQNEQYQSGSSWTAFQTPSALDLLVPPPRGIQKNDLYTMSTDERTMKFLTTHKVWNPSKNEGSHKEELAQQNQHVSRPATHMGSFSRQASSIDDDVFEVRFSADTQMEKVSLMQLADERNFSQEYASRVLTKIGVAPSRENIKILEQSFIPEDFRLSQAVERRTASKGGNKHYVSVSASGLQPMRVGTVSKASAAELHGAMPASTKPKINKHELVSLLQVSPVDLLNEVGPASSRLKSERRSSMGSDSLLQRLSASAGSPVRPLREQKKSTSPQQSPYRGGATRAKRNEVFSTELTSPTRGTHVLPSLKPHVALREAVHPHKIARELMGDTTVSLMDILSMLGADQDIETAKFVHGITSFIVRTFLDQRSPLADSIVPPHSTDDDFDFETAEQFHLLHEERVAQAARSVEVGNPRYAYFQIPSLANSFKSGSSSMDSPAYLSPSSYTSRSKSRSPNDSSFHGSHSRQTSGLGEDDEEASEASLNLPQRLKTLLSDCLVFVAKQMKIARRAMNIPSRCSSSASASGSPSSPGHSASVSAPSSSPLPPPPPPLSFSSSSLSGRTSPPAKTLNDNTELFSRVRLAVQQILIQSFPAWASSNGAAHTLSDVDNFVRLLMHKDIFLVSAENRTKRNLSPLVRILISGEPPTSLEVRRLVWEGGSASNSDDEMLLHRVLSVLDAAERWELLGSFGNHVSQYCRHDLGRSAYKVLSREKVQHRQDLLSHESKRATSPDRSSSSASRCSNTESLDDRRRRTAARKGFLSNKDFEKDYLEVQRMVTGWTSPKKTAVARYTPKQNNLSSSPLASRRQSKVDAEDFMLHSTIDYEFDA